MRPRLLAVLSGAFSGAGAVFERFIMNKIRNWGAATLATVTAGAYAAVPADVTTALGAIKTDALEIAGVVLLAIVAVFAFKFLRKGL